MKYTLSTTLCTALLLALSSPGASQSKATDNLPIKASTTQKSPPAPPSLTADQKLAVKDFQLMDANLQLQILSAQSAQRANQDRAAQFLSTLCKSDDGKKYVVNVTSLACVADASGSK